MTPQEYCEQKTVTARSSFYYSFLFLEPTQRQAMMALYAFCREVDDIVDECTEPDIAHTKLGWWREEIDRAFQDRPQHPVTRALAPFTERYNLPQEYFLEIIDGMEMDLQYTAYPSFKELALYCYRAASVVGLLTAEILGYEDRRTLRYAHDLGMAFQLTNILRDVREDALRNRLYMPLDELDQFGVSPEDVAAHRMSEPMRALLAHQAQRAHEYYQQAFRQLPEVDRYRQRSGVIMAEIYQSTLKAIANRHYEILAPQPVRLSPWRKLWIAWQTARREKRRYLKVFH